MIDTITILGGHGRSGEAEAVQRHLARPERSGPIKHFRRRRGCVSRACLQQPAGLADPRHRVKLDRLAVSGVNEIFKPPDTKPDDHQIALGRVDIRLGRFLGILGTELK